MRIPEPKISVALCTYNGATYLHEQLATLTGQSRLPDDLVICDDRSTDKTLAIARSFARGAPFSVSIEVNEKTLGTTKNFERAISLCSGDLIALCDQDDVWQSDKLECLAGAFAKSSDVGIVFSDADIVDAQLRPLGYSLWHYAGFNRSRRNTADLQELLKHNPALGMTIAFRATFRNLVLPIPENVPHDIWIALLVAALTRKVALVDKLLVKYRQHPEQQTGDLSQRTSFLKKGWRQPGDGKSLLENLVLYREVLSRLETLPTSDVPTLAKALVKAKVDHLTARVTMPRRKLRRLPVIAREFFGLRYHRYSNGAFSAAKDAFL
jgi:hypothetical protein